MKLVDASPCGGAVPIKYCIPNMQYMHHIFLKIQPVNSVEIKLSSVKTDSLLINNYDDG